MDSTDYARYSTHGHYSRSWRLQRLIWKISFSFDVACATYASVPLSDSTRRHSPIIVHSIIDRQFEKQRASFTEWYDRSRLTEQYVSLLGCPPKRYRNATTGRWQVATIHAGPGVASPRNPYSRVPTAVQLLLLSAGACIVVICSGCQAQLYSSRIRHTFFSRCKPGSASGATGNDSRPIDSLSLTSAAASDIISSTTWR